MVSLKSKAIVVIKIIIILSPIFKIEFLSLVLNLLVLVYEESRGNNNMENINDNQMIISLQDELSSLAKFEGITLRRIQNTITLKRVLNAESDDFASFKRKFSKAVNLIDDDETKNILLSIYRLDSTLTDITLLNDRRHLLCEKHHVSLDSIIEIQKTGINELSKIMLKVYKNNL